MPAYAEEIEAGLAEGVELEELVAPVAVHVQGRHADRRAVHQRNKLGERDASGRQKPVPIPGSEFDVELDTLIVAISEEPETDGLDGLRLTRVGHDLRSTPSRYATGPAGRVRRRRRRDRAEHGDRRDRGRQERGGDDRPLRDAARC